MADTSLYLLPYSPTEFLFITHHLVAMAFVVTTITRGRGAISCIVMLCFGECTSIWQNSWYFCTTLYGRFKVSHEFLEVLSLLCQTLRRSLLKSISPCITDRIRKNLMQVLIESAPHTQILDVTHSLFCPFIWLFLNLRIYTRFESFLDAFVFSQSTLSLCGVIFPASFCSFHCSKANFLPKCISGKTAWHIANLEGCASDKICTTVQIKFHIAPVDIDARILSPLILFLQWLDAYSVLVSYTYPGSYILVRSIVGPPAVIFLCWKLGRSRLIPKPEK